MIGLHDCGASAGPSPSRSGVAHGGGVSERVSGGGSVREKTAQAVDYYNNTVLRARVNAGLSAPRASYNDRHHHHGSRRQHLAQDSLYRSNSSLELQDHHQHHSSEQNSPVLRREYGSHGSIDVISGDRPGPVSGTGESFFTMLQEYRPAVFSVIGTDQRSPGPSEYLRSKMDSTLDHSLTEDTPDRGTTSPKLRLKLHRFWSSNSGQPPSSASKPLNRSSIMDDSIVSSNNNVTTSTDIEERQRRRAFAHYDCQSMTANLGYAAKLRGLLLARRRNTTTGASAASMLNSRSATPDGDSVPRRHTFTHKKSLRKRKARVKKFRYGDEDSGDGQTNDLLESCPFFRNEIGGEEERVVSLTRVHSKRRSSLRRPLHIPPLAYGVSVLEFSPGETHWRRATCPYQRLPRPIETVDEGAKYYRYHFCGQEHQNWFGMDDNLGPVAISIKREKIQQYKPTNSDNQSSQMSCYQYRLVIRTSELLTLRGAVIEDAIPGLKQGNSKGMNVKEVLEYVAPELQLNCLRLGIQSPQTEEQLLKLDEQGLTEHYKVGIMYCKAGQASEEEMYNNEEAGAIFKEFLDCIGQTVRLKGFDKYKAGLDNKTDSTGLYSVYAKHNDCEIMFHVSTMLPFTPNNRQQLLRKRHIGNDIVTIVFQEPGAQPFTPKNIRSQFQHVFIVVRAVNPCTENTHYSIAVSRSKEVPVFGPPIKDGALYPKSKTFADFLLAKVINAENAAHRSEKFATMATRTRQEYLKDLANNYTTTTLIDTGQKFSIFSSKKKDKPRPAFISSSNQRGAISWQVILDDSGQSLLVDCYLGISTDTLVLIEDQSRQIIFITPCQSILGWSAQTNSLRIYHHQGECITIHMREGGGERDELLEIMERLKEVTQGCVAQELSLKRNSVGQLGFHVQPDGVVTQVETMGLAWHAGLRQGARLVEICKVAVSTLSHDQMVDLLKTSILVTVTIIPPFPDNTPRRGCTLQNCKYTTIEGDYENVTPSSDAKGKNAQLQQAVPGNHKRYERSFSPPRSSNSSGYGTGGSSKSFERFNEGTMTSSSSGHSSDDRWYEVLETPDYETNKTSTPPPLPARHNSSAFQNVTPKRNMDPSHSLQQLSLTHHYHVHNKVQVSHSLPLPHPNFSIMLNSNNPNNFIEYEHEKVGLKPQINESRVHPRTANIEYLVTRAPKIDFPENRDGHSTDTSSISDKGIIQSDDELSGNSSPRTRRKNKPSTPNHKLNSSNNNSRNHSPRPVNGETKLRPGVTPRSNRSSANLSSSTLQEDLMKLINPDYEETEYESKTYDNLNSLQYNGIDQKDLNTKPRYNSNSRENLNYNGLESRSRENINNQHPEVIFTMARPATVISNPSTASSPAPSEFKLSKEERLSPRVKMADIIPEPLPLPDAGDMDWPSLVDTATRAMLQVSTDGLEGEMENGQWNEDDRMGMDASITSTVSTSTSVPELQSHVTELESRVTIETRRRKSLEDEVRRLREENRRLQDESQAAAHQLRRFTEWFFQTIDKQ